MSFAPAKVQWKHMLLIGLDFLYQTIYMIMQSECHIAVITLAHNLHGAQMCNSVSGGIGNELKGNLRQLSK